MHFTTAEGFIAAPENRSEGQFALRVFFKADDAFSGGTCKYVRGVRLLVFLGMLTEVHIHLFWHFFYESNDCTFFNQGTVLYACSFTEQRL